MTVLVVAGAQLPAASVGAPRSQSPLQLGAFTQPFAGTFTVAQLPWQPELCAVSVVPLHTSPLGVPQALVRGGLDWRMVNLGSASGSMPVYGERARTAGDSMWVVMSDSTNHFTMLDPQQSAFAVLLTAYRDALSAIRRRR